MITIADALIFALLVGVIVLLWVDRNRIEMLEEEVDELWDNLQSVADETRELITTLDEKIENGKQD